MILPDSSIFLPLHFLVFLYAEIHYRFPFFPFSRYHKREPEIIVDAPHRLEPDSPLPILLLIKDAHKFPIHLKSIRIQLEDEGRNIKTRNIENNLQIEDPWWDETFEIDSGGLSGDCSVRAVVSYSIGGKAKQCLTHNFRGSPQQDLNTFVARDSLPGKEEGWHWGDLHYHSSFTEDYVEFGAPLGATRHAARALGLSFVCIADHSYDLNDAAGSWRQTDTELTKWKVSRRDMAKLNTDSPPLLIPSEEVTTRNSRGRNVHTLVLNHPSYFPGSGDGAEKWFHTKSELSAAEIIRGLTEDSVAIAAHPRMPFSRLGQLLLNRGRWEEKDHEIRGLAGFEILNGSFDEDFHDGLHQWVRLLLRGEKKFIYAGNDAHGNWNRFRQIKLPMVSLWDHSNHIFGKCRTGVKLQERATVAGIVKALKTGNCVVSNGPLLHMEAENGTSTVTIGRSIHGKRIRMLLTCKSTKEFGCLRKLALHLGDIRFGEETIVAQKGFQDGLYQAHHSVDVDALLRSCYVRGVLSTETQDGEARFCYTNPIWINR